MNTRNMCMHCFATGGWTWWTRMLWLKQSRDSGGICFPRFHQWQNKRTIFGWFWGLPLSSMLGASSGAARSPWRKWCNQTLRWQRLEFGSMCALHPANVSVCMLACPILFSYWWEHGSKAMYVEQSLLTLCFFLLLSEFTDVIAPFPFIPALWRI